jgi:hypothetical protein
MVLERAYCLHIVQVLVEHKLPKFNGDGFEKDLYEELSSRNEVYKVDRILNCRSCN